MIPSMVFFLLFHEDDMNIQKPKDRLLSDVSEHMLNSLKIDEKKISDMDIEIIELAQTSAINHQNSDSPELQKVLNPNYWQSLKVVMSSKVLFNHYCFSSRYLYCSLKFKLYLII